MHIVVESSAEVVQIKHLNVRFKELPLFHCNILKNTSHEKKMESVLSVIEPQHESFTIDKSVGRLSDEIDQFNQDTTNVLLMCAYHSVECCRVIEHHYRANSE